MTVDHLLALAHISAFTTKTEQLGPHTSRTLYLTPPASSSTPTISDNSDTPIAPTSPEPKVFLVANKSTLELRTDLKLSHLLQSKYETVMQSRYFGKGGIEIVPSPQLPDSDLADLIRLSYNLTQPPAQSTP